MVEYFLSELSWYSKAKNIKGYLQQQQSWLDRESVLDDNSNLKCLRNICCKYPKNVIISYVNINSIRNTLDNLNLQVDR